MAEYNYRRNLARRRRMRRIRRIKILLLILSVLMLTSSGVLLMLHVRSLESRVKDMEILIGQLTETAEEQQLRLQEALGMSIDIEEVPGQAPEQSAEPVTEQSEANQSSAESADGQLPDGQEAVDSQMDEQEYQHKVYLTFDDGPSTNTDEILDILERYDVKATFFVVGKEEEYAKEMLRQIADAGHTIGLHSYSHDYSALYKSVEDFAADFQKQQDFIYQVTGQNSTVYRFPGGSSNSVSEIDMQEFVDYLHSEGVEYYDWNASVGDGGSNLLDVDTLVSNATKTISSWETTILLMHDAPEKPTTVEALPRIIEKIQAIEGSVLLPITKDTFPVHHIDE